MRITGLATGLDMDEIIKNSMKPYRIKIDKKGQDKEILEIKQKLYREVIKDSREFYNKYFDVASSNSLLLSKNWSSVQFTSSNDSLVSVTGSGDARVDNYKVSGTVAKANKVEYSGSIENGEKILINGVEFTLTGETERERATNLNNALKEAGINVSVKYTDFIESNTGKDNKSGFVFESKVLGKDSGFTVGGKFSHIGIKNNWEKATAATITGFKSNDFKIDGDNVISLMIGEEKKEITINGEKIKNEDGTVDNEKLIKELNNELKSHKLSAEINDDGDITFTSTVLGKDNIVNPELSINDNLGTFTEGKNEVKASTTVELSNMSNKKLVLDNVLIDLSKAEGNIDDYINKVLKEQGKNVVASLSNDGKNLILTSKLSGEDTKVDVSILEVEGAIAKGGVDANLTITNSNGGKYVHTGISNNVTLDGVNFKFNGDITGDAISITGKQDVTEIKDNLVKFFNDYNILVEKINKLTTEKRNRDFTPLTEDQKKEMSEDEIKLWNEKVEKGQLSRDMDLTRINNSLKQAMRTFVDGTGGLNLEKIGISPVADYAGTKNGTFTIDENKLTKALEENSEEIMNMFIKNTPKNDELTYSKKYSQTGIMQRLKTTLYDEFMTVTASLMKKAGFEGTSMSYNNDITRSIEKYEQKMSDMEKDFSRREQALYTKYANLETMMNKYNSQQSYLMQQLGLG
ncbi:flagellar cap protein FliD [Clostridium sartagoforme]|uniref:Flagellar hook-associated protein 2 n=1 Tax=Clostridium sartagoforme TaxID=84031 RepID=A0A4S2DPN8_9CLOT|nr:flagellar filament capping protein FliD [Clostridium sartagoforme]TGY43782.1 flagellar cap protein FliD [Clostridium sartagoforme]